MKKIATIFIVLVALSLQAQKTNYNLKRGFVAEGYDITEYFNNKSIKGSSEFITTHDGVKYKFVNQENLDKFLRNPEKFIPQYGGYCAYAIGKDGKKVDINPETYEIRDGKLFLFYNSWGINTLQKWQEEGATELKTKADTNWLRIVSKNK